MIGSHEYEEDSVDNNIFIPLVDGSLIRYDKEGFLEVSLFSVIIAVEDRVQRAGPSFRGVLQQRLVHSDRPL